jgi:hypothetical protein
MFCSYFYKVLLLRIFQVYHTMHANDLSHARRSMGSRLSGYTPYARGLRSSPNEWIIQ